MLDITGKDVQRHISFHRLSTNALGGEISEAMKGNQPYLLRILELAS